MIRVNLLPQKKKQERGKVKIEAAPSGQRWLLIPLLLVVAEIIALVFFHIEKKGDIDKLQASNNTMNGKIQQIQQLVTQHDAVKKQLAELRAREDAITQLQAGRTGPTAAVLELAQILTAGKGPTVDPDRMKKLEKDHPLEQVNLNWDSKRLWISHYSEQDRTVKIEGYAKDSQDVSEFATRLKASSYFYNIVLLPGKKDEAGDGLVSFGVELKVRY